MPDTMTEREIGERVYAFQLMREGGEWLGALRERVKCKRCFGNGCDITWGSDELLDPPLTMREVEELGAEAAAAAINEERAAHAKTREEVERPRGLGLDGVDREEVLKDEVEHLQKTLEEAVGDMMAQRDTAIRERDEARRDAVALFEQRCDGPTVERIAAYRKATNEDDPEPNPGVPPALWTLGGISDDAPPDIARTVIKANIGDDGWQLFLCQEHYENTEPGMCAACVAAAEAMADAVAWHELRDSVESGTDAMYARLDRYRAALKSKP
jgi:hypothetical protein